MVDALRQAFCHQGSTMMFEPPILRNSAICLVCEQEVVSEFTWDFRTCSCGNLSVDGGLEYTRRVFKAYGTWKETTVYEVEDGK